MAVDPKKLQFYTLFNYQKVAEAGGDTLSIGIGATATKTVTHNLGYIPTVRAFYENEDGWLMPVVRNQYIDGSSSLQVNPVGQVWLTTTTAVIELTNNGSGSVNTPVYWRIYYDD